ncbi:hypothetical protein, partial [Inquilinus limosus]|uniref:hypothetical protein n=1 Tax=Inquilinus limosus TaxID=171674 RepID=UPI001269B19A
MLRGSSPTPGGDHRDQQRRDADQGQPLAPLDIEQGGVPQHRQDEGEVGEHQRLVQAAVLGVGDRHQDGQRDQAGGQREPEAAEQAQPGAQHQQED